MNLDVPLFADSSGGQHPRGGPGKGAKQFDPVGEPASQASPPLSAT